MARFPMFFVIVDAVLILLRVLLVSIAGALTNAASVVKGVPIIGGFLSMLIKFPATIFIGAKALITVIVVVFTVVTIVLVIRWIISKIQYKQMKKEVKKVKHERKLERISEGKGTGERLGNLAEDAAHTGLKTVEKMTSFLP